MAAYFCVEIKNERNSMTQINKTAQEFTINIITVILVICASLYGIWWISLPVVYICCYRLFSVMKNAIKSKRLSTDHVLKVLSKVGYQTHVSDSGEIIVESEGHQYLIQCNENGNIHFTRRFLVPADELQILKKAAEQTMSEVYMAKVIVDKCDDPGKGVMVFSVETVCSSEKELKATICEHMHAIDCAEDSQRKYAEKLQAQQPQQAVRKRIGFV